MPSYFCNLLVINVLAILCCDSSYCWCSVIFLVAFAVYNSILVAIVGFTKSLYIFGEDQNAVVEIELTNTLAVAVTVR